jgi:hypothetical protein
VGEDEQQRPPKSVQLGSSLAPSDARPQRRRSRSCSKQENQRQKLESAKKRTKRQGAEEVRGVNRRGLVKETSNNQQVSTSKKTIWITGGGF